MDRDGNDEFVFVDCPAAPCQWIPSCSKCGHEVCGLCGLCHNCEDREKEKKDAETDKA